MRKQRRRIAGYTDMGGVRVPPLPMFIIMEDRASTLPYVLTHTGTYPALVFSASLTLPSTTEYTRYGPYAGPYLNGNIRLFINGGVLNAEFAQATGKVSTQKVLTRRGVEDTLIWITAPTTWKEGDALTYTPISV